MKTTILSSFLSIKGASIIKIISHKLVRILKKLEFLDQMNYHQLLEDSIPVDSVLPTVDRL
jgi:hypothetical protein